MGQNEFGMWAIEKYGSFDNAAVALEVTRQHIHQLSSGRFTPSLRLIAKIDALSRGRFTADYWLDILEKLPARTTKRTKIRKARG